MKKSSVLDLKKMILSEFDKTIVQNIKSESFAIQQPEKRLSIGYIENRRDNFILQIRVQREGSFAHKQAIKYKEQARGEAEIGIVPKIEIPSINLILQNAKKYRSSFRLFTKNRRPLHIGCSVGHLDGGPGTLGAFIESGENIGFLSCCHVLALSGSAAPKKDHIYHPGRPDKKRLTSEDRVALLQSFIDISRVNSNDVDCAYATILPNVDHDGNAIPKHIKTKLTGKRFGKMVAVDDLRLNEPIAKIGRTSLYTEGVVTTKALDNVIITIPGVGNVMFNNLVEIKGNSGKNFSHPGDSGSVVFTKNGIYPFGLHFAGGLMKGENGKWSPVSYSCDLTECLDSLDISLLK